MITCLKIQNQCWKLRSVLYTLTIFQTQQKQDHIKQFFFNKLFLQVAFEAKQANMFVALDKLFALHNAMLLESRVIKAFVIYFLSIFVIYMFTSTKQTYIIRPRLYIGKYHIPNLFLIPYLCQ